MIVYTVGTWDLLHVGHLALLEYCKTLGAVVAVGVASDNVVSRYKPNEPVVPLNQRMEMLKALQCVDIVRPYYELEYASACKALNVDIFVIGEDWGKKPHNLGVESYLKTAGKQIVQVSYNPQTSSTEIKERVVAQAISSDYQVSYSCKAIEKKMFTVNQPSIMSSSDLVDLAL
ncbi:MAG: cytidylyltransferase [Moraxellaceae bacterium]|nr:MAG: cytidylyltransferase [Moraxellaceae bacterium]